MNLVLFCVWGRLQVWAHWNHFCPVDCDISIHKRCCGHQGIQAGAAAVASGLMSTTSFVDWYITVHRASQRWKEHGPQNRGERSEQVWETSEDLYLTSHWEEGGHPGNMNRDMIREGWPCWGAWVFPWRKQEVSFTCSVSTETQTGGK